MTSKKNLQIAYGLAIALFVVGVLSYAAFPAKPPEEPIRIMFKNIGGKVLFSHRIHTSDDGYGFACTDCHHHPEDESELRACGDCHLGSDQGEGLAQSCTDCHEADELEGSEVMKRSESFHSQCMDCHKENEAGPLECSGCHLL